jgi:hypothetical protein
VTLQRSQPASEPSPRTGKRQRWLWSAAAIACAVLLITVLVVEIDRPTSSCSGSTATAPKPTAAFGPKVIVSGENASALGNNTTVSLQVYAAVPPSFAKGGPVVYPISPLAQGSNGADDELLNVTLLAQNYTSAFFLAPSFDTIAAEWATALAAETGTNYPSLTVVAVKTIVENGTALLYQEVNNLPFDPSNLRVVELNQTRLAANASGWFNGTGIDPSRYSAVSVTALAFNLTLAFPNAPLPAIPARTGSTTAARSALVLASPYSCGASYFYTRSAVSPSTLLQTSYANGTLPFLGTHIGRNADSGQSQIDYFGALTALNDTLNFDSESVYESAARQVTTTMSTNASFTRTGNASTSNGGNSYGVLPTAISTAVGNNESDSLNQTTGFVGLPGVEYEFQHFSPDTYFEKDYWTPQCSQGNVKCTNTLVSQSLQSTVYDGNFTIGGIAELGTSTGIQVQAGYESIWAAWTIQHTLLEASNGTVTLTTSGNGSSYQAQTIWDSTYGWSRAAQAYARDTKALAVFSLPMGMGLAMSVVPAVSPSLPPDSTEVEVVAQCMKLIAQSLDMSPQNLGLFSSISYLTGFSQAVGAGWAIANQPFFQSGSNYTMAFFESQSPVSFTENGNTYSFYAPEDYLNATGIV